MEVETRHPAQSAAGERSRWVDLLLKVVGPPLRSSASGDLTVQLSGRGLASPEVHATPEALARSLAGAAAWLGAPQVPKNEQQAHSQLFDCALAGLSREFRATKSTSFNAERGSQVLVESALLALALWRATPLWGRLDADVRSSILDTFQQVSRIKPWFNNWVLFPALLEAFLARAGRPYCKGSIRFAIGALESWYLGDGVYADGPSAAVDYYNSFVIHPFLLTLMELDEGSGLLVPRKHQGRIEQRAKRHAETLTRLIAQDGSFPAIGRSLTYRCGAFHLLGHLAWREKLPDSLPPRHVRSRLRSAIEWSLSPEGTFDSHGWLSIGFQGSQPELAERYISAGSPYFCATAFLPLGLAPTHSFWDESSPRSAGNPDMESVLLRDIPGEPRRRFRGTYFLGMNVLRPLVMRLTPSRKCSAKLPLLS